MANYRWGTENGRSDSFHTHTRTPTHSNTVHRCCRNIYRHPFGVYHMCSSRHSTAQYPIFVAISLFAYAHTQLLLIARTRSRTLHPDFVSANNATCFHYSSRSYVHVLSRRMSVDCCRVCLCVRNGNPITLVVALFLLLLLFIAAPAVCVCMTDSNGAIQSFWQIGSIRELWRCRRDDTKHEKSNTLVRQTTTKATTKIAAAAATVAAAASIHGMRELVLPSPLHIRCVHRSHTPTS